MEEEFDHPEFATGADPEAPAAASLHISGTLADISI
jgi:hypothetical protein